MLWPAKHNYKKHIFSLTLFVLFWLGMFACTIPSGKAYIIACDVGQGDAILIIKNTFQILIDGGPNDKVLDCLADSMPFWDRQIELVINTHPDKDHLQGLVQVLSEYNVSQVLLSQTHTDSELNSTFNELIKSKNINIYYPEAGDTISAGDFTFDILWPQEAPDYLASGQTLGISDSSNTDSIVALMHYRDKSALFTGDIGFDQEEELLEQGRFTEVDVLKVAHHGSKYSTSDEFLEKADPKIAIISVGKNPWGHPTAEVLQKLNSAGAKILRTDQDKIKILLD